MILCIDKIQYLIKSQYLFYYKLFLNYFYTIQTILHFQYALELLY